MEDWRGMLRGLQATASAVFGNGTPYTFHPYDGASVTPDEPGIFRAPAAELEGADEVGVRSAGPTMDVHLDQLPHYPRPGTRDTFADEVTVHFTPGMGFQWSADQRFRIVDEQPDGEGMTTLVLHELKP